MSQEIKGLGVKHLDIPFTENHTSYFAPGMEDVTVDLTYTPELKSLDITEPFDVSPQDLKDSNMTKLEQIDLAMSVLPSSYRLFDELTGRPMRRLSLLEGMEYERRLKRDVGLSGAFYGGFLGEDRNVLVKKETL